MKTFRLIAAALIFAAVPAISAYAQTGNGAGNGVSQTANAGRVVVIDTADFAGTDEKGTGGINKYVAGLNQVDNEFKPALAEIQTMVTKYQALGKDLETLQKNSQNPNIPIDQAGAQAKADQYTAMETDIKRKQEDLKAKYARRQDQIMGPINQEIGKALQEFAKQKGFAMILDIGKLANAGAVLALDDKSDVTKDFIAFYNTRPATTATTARP